MANLLDRSSLVLTPTAYNNGEALCIKPDDGSGDFDFSRNSAATRVNAQGLVENVQILSSNLVQNGDFSEEGVQEVTNGDFSNGTNDWVFTSGATLTALGAKITHTPTAGSIAQLSVLTIGKQYKLTYEITESISGGLKFNSAVDASMVTTVGVHTKYFEADGTTAVIGRTSATDNDVTITNISVKEVGQNWDLNTGWEIGDGVAVATSGAASKLTQSISGLSGKKCSVTFTLSNYGGNGTIKLDFGSVVGQNINANGTYTEVGTYDIDRLEFFKNSSFSGSITNISVIEITDDTNLPRINYEGFSYQDALGSELIVNGDYENNIDFWAQYLSLSTWDNGTIKTTSTSSVAWIRQNDVLSSGKIYIITFKAKSTNISQNIKIWNGANFVDTNLSFDTVNEYKNFTYQLDFSGGGGQHIIIGQISISIGDSVNFDNVSVKEYLGQEVVPDSGCGSWLFEPQTTQLVLYSEDFSQSSWSKGSDISIESGYLAPDGNNTAYKVSEIGAATSYLTNNIGLTSTTTRSVYARTISGTGTATLLSHNSNTNNVFTLTEQWQRFELNNTASPSGLSTFYAADFRGSGTLTEYLVWGANATNDQDYATSYIPSNGSQVTRNQDVCTNGGSLASINSTEGVLYAEIARSEEENLYRLLGIDDGTSNNYVKMGFENSRGAFWIRAVINGVTSISSDNALTSNPNEFYKIAIRYQSGNSAIYINGTSVLTTTTTFSSGNFTALDFNHWNNSLNFFGKTKAVAVWKEALSDQELTELTTI